MDQIFHSLGVVPNIVYAQIIAVVVLFFVLKKFLFGPIGDIMRLRNEQVANSLSGAEAQRLQAESLRKDYEGHLANIAEEARQKLEQALHDAEAARQRMLDATQEEIHRLHERHEAQLALDREQLRRELRSEVSDLAVMAATKALRNQLTPTLQSAVVDQVLTDLRNLPPQ